MLDIILDKPYVYTLARPSGIVFYVGKGTNERIHDHEWEAAREDRPAYKLHKSKVIRKIWREGGQVQKSIIGYFNTDKQAHEYEIALIFFLRPYGNLANITDGGEGCRGWVHSDKSRHKMAESRKGRTLSEEHKKKIGEAGKGRVGAMKGKKDTEETRLKKSKSQHQRSKDTAKGVYFDKKASKWFPRRTINGKGIALGYFDTEEEAREVYLKSFESDLTEEALINIREHHKERAKSKIKGYYLQNCKWYATRRINGKPTYLGTFNTEQEAREAYLKSFENIQAFSEPCDGRTYSVISDANGDLLAHRA